MKCWNGVGSTQDAKAAGASWKTEATNPTTSSNLRNVFIPFPLNQYANGERGLSPARVNATRSHSKYREITQCQRQICPLIRAVRSAQFHGCSMGYYSETLPVVQLYLLSRSLSFCRADMQCRRTVTCDNPRMSPISRVLIDCKSLRTKTIRSCRLSLSRAPRALRTRSADSRHASGDIPGSHSLS